MDSKTNRGRRATTCCETFGNHFPPWPQWFHLCIGQVALPHSSGLVIILKAEDLELSSLH